MHKSMSYFVCFVVALTTLLIMPSSSHAGGFFNNMLNSAVGSAVSKIDSSITQHMNSPQQAPSQNASPTQQAPRQPAKPAHTAKPTHTASSQHAKPAHPAKPTHTASSQPAKPIQQASGQSAKPVQQASSQLQNGSHNGTPAKENNSQANLNKQVAIKGAYYKEYKYTFTGKLNLKLSGFKSKSYTGWVISEGGPDYKIKGFHLDIGGMDSGWVLSKQSTPNYWSWNRPEGSLRVNLTIATPATELPSPGAATINIFGTFIGNYTFSTANNLTTTPIGPPSFDDKITSKEVGSTSFTHYIKETTALLPSVYPGASLDILGIKPGMNREEVRKKLAEHYKGSKISKTPIEMKTNYKSAVYLSSQPFINLLQDKSSDPIDSITVMFGTPATGNKVIAIHRELDFNAQNAPKISQIVSALHKKYGPETLVTDKDYTGARIWLFGKDGLVKSSSQNQCSITEIDFSIDDNTPNSSVSNTTGATSPNYACIGAIISPLGDGDSRVGNLTVDEYSMTNAKISIDEASKQMHAAALVDYKRVFKPKVPKL